MSEKRDDDPAHKLLAVAWRAARRCALILLAYVAFVLAVVLSGLLT